MIDEPTPGVTAWHRLDRFLARWRPRRQPISLLIDAAIVVLAWNATYLFRLGFERWTSARPDYDVWVIAFLTCVYAIVFLALGIPRTMWRFSGFGEIRRLTLACLLAGLVGAATIQGLHLRAVPRAVLALHPLVTLMVLCMVRLAYRMLYEHARAQITGGEGEPRRAVVLGAGEAARLLLAGLPQQGWTVLGLFDDDPGKLGARVLGVPVRGPLDALLAGDAVAGATHVIVAMPGASPGQRRRAMELAAATRLPVLTVPSAAELQAGTARIERVRRIEPEDLLGREPVELDEGGIAELVSGRVVLVTGAGGSIGSELCRQIACYGPSRIVLYESSELALYQIEQQLGELHPHLPVVRLIGDVRNAAHVDLIFDRHRPHLVFHAAAYKHVPLMEEGNAWAALQNNVIGTRHVAAAALAHRAERFVLISSDKAVNPTNVMGATKRAAEMVVSMMAGRGSSTRFMAVRFGNVLGSSGSVIPKFKEQIARGGPVTVTHPEIIRYFMTVSEAVRLVLQAATIGESGQVLVLDMGEPVKIVDLARQMIRLSGHSVDEIPIRFTGLRPGEKLYEELLADSDSTLPTAIPSLRIARLETPTRALELLESDLLATGQGWAADEEVRAALARVVPEYRPAGRVSDAARPATMAS